MTVGNLFSLNIYDYIPWGSAASLTLFFRKGGPEDKIILNPEKTAERNTFQKIRCPLCKWTPDKYSLWTCWDVGYPEYYFNGCGTEWHTFDTRGVCPTCNHQWQWTSCLSCWGWSRHEDWYETG